MDFLLDKDLELSLDFFRVAFMHLSPISTRGPSSMVFEHLWDVFDLKDSTNNFIQFQ